MFCATGKGQACFATEDQELTEVAENGAWELGTGPEQHQVNNTKDRQIYELDAPASGFYRANLGAGGKRTGMFPTT